MFQKNITNIKSTMSLIIILVFGMIDICSSYCEDFIQIPLSIAMWHGIFENWRITKLLFQRKWPIPWNITQTYSGIEIINFSREKHISSTIIWREPPSELLKSEKELKSLKTSKKHSQKSKPLKRESNYEVIHSKDSQMAKSSHWTGGTKCSSLKKNISSFGALKKSKFIILPIIFPISRVVVTVYRLIYSL